MIFNIVTYVRKMIRKLNLFFSYIWRLDLIGKFQGTSIAFYFFITKLVSTGFLVSSHILIRDNASICLMEENKFQQRLFGRKKKFRCFTYHCTLLS